MKLPRPQPIHSRLARSRLVPGRSAVAIVAVSAAALAGCGSPASGGGSAEPLSVAPAAAPLAATVTAKCKDGQPPTASLKPNGPTPADNLGGPTIDKIKQRGRLIVGTSGDVRLWGARNPQTGKLEGYDIELVQQIAKALGVGIEYKVINYGQRLPSLADGSVDLVAHTMTINCDRWQGTGAAANPINFSSEYYQAGQKVLVRYDPVSKQPEFTGITQLNGKRVCVASDSTNIEELKKYPKVIPVPVADLGDCLVKFQEGEVDAITGDDTVMAGFAAQDPYALVVGNAFTVEPYGLGISAADTGGGFTRFVNAVLEKLRADGTLNKIYEHTMAAAVSAVPTPPAPIYGRNISALGRK